MRERSDYLCCLLWGEPEEWFALLSSLRWHTRVIQFVVFPGMSQRSYSFFCLLWHDSEEWFILLSFLSCVESEDWLILLSFLGWVRGEIHFSVFPGESQRGQYILLSFLGRARGRGGDTFCCLSWGEPEELFFKLWVPFHVKDPIYTMPFIYTRLNLYFIRLLQVKYNGFVFKMNFYQQPM